ncbi:hypothetical protein [Vibrio sp. V39_P1S14PM300]|uniref:hypothetical protein n=1 Tax=Vibrio sp. V39_P1S14PM300 TaxID=1938690 RepID=UPI0013737409|nr:hypothetical protein [Vibrio sp. V39_P1S14PM300]NAX20464.1 hypothetical protein [Vibrio sp. V39_P1S14PM300]
MLWETLERVNRLRQQAMSDSEFIQSAKEHQKALEAQAYCYQSVLRKKPQSKSEKTLADIYDQAEFGTNPTGTQH